MKSGRARCVALSRLSVQDTQVRRTPVLGAPRRWVHAREGEEVDHAETGARVLQRRHPRGLFRDVRGGIALQETHDDLAHDAASDRPEVETAGVLADV